MRSRATPGKRLEEAYPDCRHSDARGYIGVSHVDLGTVRVDSGLIGGVGGGADTTAALRRCRPRTSKDLSRFDPGPDLIDWIGAIAPIVAGVGLIIVAIIV